MKALIQKVIRGQVTVDGQVVGSIGVGYVVFLGVRKDDLDEHAHYLADRTVALRIFPDDEERMNRSILDVGGSALVISQFTLQADTRKGNRPGFTDAAPPEVADRLYQAYVGHLRELLGAERVATGVFRARMLVEIHNNGPVTIELRSKNEFNC